MIEFPSIRNILNNSIQFIHTQINMKKILTIIGTVLVGGTMVAVVIIMNSRDFKAEASVALQKSKDLRNQARELSCSYIGELTDKCYKKDTAACGLLQVAETDYQAEFSVGAYDSCFAAPPQPGTTLSSGEVVESKTGIPAQKDDSLFFGDEGKLPK